MGRDADNRDTAGDGGNGYTPGEYHDGRTDGDDHARYAASGGDNRYTAGGDNRYTAGSDSRYTGDDENNRYTAGGDDENNRYIAGGDGHERHAVDEAHASNDETATERRFDLPESVANLPIVGGLILGVGAFLFSYVLTYVMVAASYAIYGVDEGNPGYLQRFFGSSEELPGTGIAAAWSMLSNFGVGLERTTGNGEHEIVGPAEFFSPFMHSLSPATVLLTVGIIVGAGYLIASYADAEIDEPLVAAATSLLLVPAYLTCAALLALLAVWSPEEADATVSAAVTDAILHAGLVYPAFFGLLGGALAVWPDVVERLGDAIQK